ncbi:MAG: hypothetical protein Phyf2KO_00060 [Phycisphaerales bacterium]
MKRRGLTITEVLIGVGVLLAILVTLAVLYINDLRIQTRSWADATRVRAIGQGFILWADAADGIYPLPSKLDLANETVAEEGRAKDTTANIMSVLVSDGYITAEVLVSRVENSDFISAYEDYERGYVRAAVDPDRAIWDPGLSADFTSETGGNISYAHLIPDMARLDMWTNNYRGDQVLLANRGPEIASVKHSDGFVETEFVNPKSRTLRFHEGARKKWSGIIGYNDNYVDLAINQYGHGKRVGYKIQEPQLMRDSESYHDVLFADEEGFPTNHFLGIFTRAGETKEDYRAIWD